jgi:4-amino-4-deoxy-L-arabinose transferase-like glycosyltransferase
MNSTRGASGTLAWRALLITCALTALHCFFWYWAAQREGTFRQEPVTDAACDLRTAEILRQKLAAGDFRGAAHSWIHENPVHTPVVPTVSAVLMLIFGPSRVVAESALVLFTFLFIFSAYWIAARFYDTKTALATAGLATAFPLFLGYSRIYLFEHPLAGMFGITCVALVLSDGFRKTGPTLLFGILAGITSLTRGGAPVYLVGPGAVAFLVSWKGGAPRGPLLLRTTAAAALAGAMAAVWYVPNYAIFSEYVHRATYGSEAVAKSAGGSFSLENLIYYLNWIVIEGPGYPMAGVALAAFLFAVAERKRVEWSPFLLSLAAVFGITLFLLLLAAQREGARYFQPLTPILALTIVRAVVTVRNRMARWTFGIATGALAAHHVIAMVFTIPVPLTGSDGLGIAGDFVLYRHRNYFLDAAASMNLEDPGMDFRLNAVIDALHADGISKNANVLMLYDENPFFQCNAMMYEMAKRRIEWNMTNFILSPREAAPNWRAAVLLHLKANDYAIVRLRSPEMFHSTDWTAMPALQAIVREAGRPCRAVLDAPLPDGSRIIVICLQ